MVSFLLRPFLILVASFALNTQSAVTQDKETIILVDLGIKTPADADRCYMPNFDLKKVQLQLEMDDTLFFLQDFLFEEDPLEGPDCFLPDLKIIFKTETYVISTYCNAVKKYRNSAAYRPSNQRIRSDVEITESVLEYLKRVQKKYLGVRYNPLRFAKFIKNDPLDTDDDINGLDLLKDDDNDDDIEKDAIDKDGTFDRIESPDEDVNNPDENDENP